MVAILLSSTTFVSLFVMIVCHMIIFVTVVRQHMRIRVLVNSELPGAPNPILLALKSAKKILAITITHILQIFMGFLGTYLQNDGLRFFCMWLAYSQSIWNCMFYLAFSGQVWKDIKNFLCPRSRPTEEPTISVENH